MKVMKEVEFKTNRGILTLQEGDNIIPLVEETKEDVKKDHPDWSDEKIDSYLKDGKKEENY